MKVRLHRNELLAVALFASKDESRFALNCVRIEVNHGKKPLLVATDGRRLCVLESQNEQPKDAGPGSVSLAIGAAKALAGFSKGVGGKLFQMLEIRFSCGMLSVSCCDVDGNTFAKMEIEHGAVVDVPFPDWRAVLPKNVQRTPVNDLAVNAEFMGDFGRLAAILDKAPTVQMNLLGKGAAIEVINPQIPNWYALIMPCASEDVNYQPEFIALVGEEDGTKGANRTDGEEDGETKVTMVMPGMKPVTTTMAKLGKKVREMEEKAES